MYIKDNPYILLQMWLSTTNEEINYLTPNPTPRYNQIKSAYQRDICSPVSIEALFTNWQAMKSTQLPIND